MPQMAPISWISLFILFSITFMIFNILNYYCFFNEKSKNINEKNESKNEMNKLDWKW